MASGGSLGGGGGAEPGAEHLPYVQSSAALLGLSISAEQRPGVLMYFALAAQMADLINGLPLTPADEAAAVFRPIAPADGA